MCFIIHFSCEQPLIAEYDIVCWKDTCKIAYTDENNFRSQIFKFDYQKDKMYFNRLSFGWNNHRKSVEAGFHSYSKIPMHDSSSVLVGEFIIPARSEYFHNPLENEFVSSHIIFKKLIK